MTSDMKRFLVSISFALALLPGTAFAAVNCDEQAKPALECPTGYGVMCIPTGGGHWGCGRENAETPAAISATEPSDTAAEPETSTATAPSEQSAFPAPSAPPTPNIPMPDASAAAEPEEFPLENAQEFLEETSEYAPDSLQPILETAAWTIGTMLALLGLWEWVKRMREKKSGKCGRCGGGTKAEEKKPCARCGGSGKIEQEYEATVKCTHCKGSGTDPCHHCGGTGKMSMPNPPQSEQELEGWPPCDFCGGSGTKKIGAGRDWGEANDAVKNGQFACCMCHGKKEETYKAKREVDCPDCKGAKR